MESNEIVSLIGMGICIGFVIGYTIGYYGGRWALKYELKKCVPERNGVKNE